MKTTIRYILLTAIRDWFFVGLFVSIFLAFAISSFLGGTALVEETQMTISYAASSSRVILLIGLIIFVCFHVRRAFENREIEVIISKPISRSEFVFAYWLGFVCVSVLLVVPIVFSLIFLGVDVSSAFYWGVSLLMESFLVVAFALFSALILKSSVVAVLLCFGFYFLSRMMGFFLFILEKPFLFKTFDLGFITKNMITVVSIILPRLDLYSKSEWLVYGVSGAIDSYVFISQSLIYIPFLLAMAIFDFRRKQF